MFYFALSDLNVGDTLYSHDQFDHAAFVDCLGDIDGQWVVSYADLLDGLADEYWCLKQERAWTITNGQQNNRSRMERLVMNFDPHQEPVFAPGAQATLDAM